MRVKRQEKYFLKKSHCGTLFEKNSSFINLSKRKYFPKHLASSSIIRLYLQLGSGIFLLIPDAHTVTSPYTHCILIHEARSLVFMIFITEQFSILHKLLMIFR